MEKKNIKRIFLVVLLIVVLLFAAFVIFLRKDDGKNDKEYHEFLINKNDVIEGANKEDIQNLVNDLKKQQDF